MPKGIPVATFAIGEAGAANAALFAVAILRCPMRDLQKAHEFRSKQTEAVLKAAPLKLVNDEVRRAAEILRAGGLVAFPTETVYGLGADASSAEAVARLYAAKGRPAESSGDRALSRPPRALSTCAREIPTAARRLAAQFWPGR
jgi:tRNA A37 threonylcarbamoyladenosine synthetase subunit TsaC/SUA5/YrdC